jgi:hypothetical protein
MEKTHQIAYVDLQLISSQPKGKVRSAILLEML